MPARDRMATRNPTRRPRTQSRKERRKAKNPKPKTKRVRLHPRAAKSLRPLPRVPRPHNSQSTIQALRFVNCGALGAAVIFTLREPKNFASSGLDLKIIFRYSWDEMTRKFAEGGSDGSNYR